MVLVCRDPAFIFLKTRKTAGTSVEMLLEPFCMQQGHAVTEESPARFSRYGIVGARLRGRGLPWYLRLRHGDWRSHKTASRVLRDLGRRQWDASVRLTTIRNPFDRMVSLFHFTRRDDPILKSGFGAVVAEFRAWVAAAEWPDDRPIVFIDNAYVIDREIRFEHLRSDTLAIAKHLGLSLDPAALPHTKSTSGTRRHAVADYFDTATGDIVRRRLSWVFERGHYPESPDAPDTVSAKEAAG